MQSDDELDLTSWKAIADYLGVGTRTAQKWEADRGLPVHRTPGEKARVWAVRAELDHWKTATSGRLHWWNDLARVRYYAAAMTLIALGAVTWGAAESLTRNHRGPPALFRADFDRLLVQDESGKDLWNVHFPEAFAANYYTDNSRQFRVWFGDLDGDSEIETVFDYFPASYEHRGTELYCFSHKGQEKWRYVPGRVIADAGGTSYPRTYITAGLIVLPAGKSGGSHIILTSRHTVHYPNQVAVLDAGGKMVGEYWNSGHLDYMTLLDLDGTGLPYVALAGVNNGFRAATLVVLDPRRVQGASSQDAGSPYQLLGLPLGTEKAVLLFPRTCINRKLELYNVARELSFYDGALSVNVWERVEDSAVVTYNLDRKLVLKSVRPSDRFQSLHRKLEADGQLDHRYSAAEEDALKKVRTMKAL